MKSCLAISQRSWYWYSCSLCYLLFTITTWLRTHCMKIWNLDCVCVIERETKEKSSNFIMFWRLNTSESQRFCKFALKFFHSFLPLFASLFRSLSLSHSFILSLSRSLSIFLFIPYHAMPFHAMPSHTQANQIWTENGSIVVQDCTALLCGVYFGISSNVDRFTCFILNSLAPHTVQPSSSPSSVPSCSCRALSPLFIQLWMSVYLFVCKFNLIWFMRSCGHSCYAFSSVFVYELNSLFLCNKARSWYCFSERIAFIYMVQLNKNACHNFGTMEQQEKWN